MPLAASARESFRSCAIVPAKPSWRAKCENKREADGGKLRRNREKRGWHAWPLILRAQTKYMRLAVGIEIRRASSSCISIERHAASCRGRRNIKEGDDGVEWPSLNRWGYNGYRRLPCESNVDPALSIGGHQRRSSKAPAVRKSAP